MSSSFSSLPASAVSLKRHFDFTYALYANIRSILLSNQAVDVLLFGFLHFSTLSTANARIFEAYQVYLRPLHQLQPVLRSLVQTGTRQAALCLLLLP
jgi:hypothetical protein